MFSALNRQYTAKWMQSKKKKDSCLYCKENWIVKLRPKVTVRRRGEPGPGGHKRQLRGAQAKAPSVFHYSYGLRKISRQSDDKGRDSEAEASWRAEREGEAESGVKLEKVSLSRVFWVLLRFFPQVH